MVNKAVEEMVSTVHGEAMWDKIKERAGVDVEVFISNEGYPDDGGTGLVFLEVPSVERRGHDDVLFPTDE